MKKVQEPTTSRIHWQLLVAALVLLSVVVLSGQELKHVPPAAPSFTVLYTFAGPPTDGAQPFAGLTLDVAGNLYGTTYVGGTSGVCLNNLNGCGTVFKLSRAGTETVLHSFTGGGDGAYPLAGLVQDAVGNLYGTTTAGGVENSACAYAATCGVVFKLSPTALTVLHSFNLSDGASPFSVLIRDAAGNLYGTTYQGGAFGYGVVFKLSPSGTETVLHSFTGGADGAQPLAGLIQDPAGNLYGTTSSGGAHGNGVVFELIRCSSSPSGYDFKVLYSFTGGADGANPGAGLIRDLAGNLYGTAGGGGITSACDVGCGVVFKLAPSGTETVLHAFTGYPTDGASPSGLIEDSSGNLYGTTGGGGTSAHGVVFKLSPSGTETVLHSFTGGRGGAIPNGLTQDAAGNLYGTAVEGGPKVSACPGNPGTCGVVFKLTPN